MRENRATLWAVWAAMVVGIVLVWLSGAFMPPYLIGFGIVWLPLTVALVGFGLGDLVAVGIDRIAACSWAVATALLAAAASFVEPDRFDLLASIWLGISALALCALFVEAVRKGRRHRFVGLLLLPLAAALLYFGGFRSPGLVRFYAQYSTYRKALASWKREERARPREAGTVRREGNAIVDFGPPLKIAFVWEEDPEELTGVVYDPSGAVAKRSRAFRKRVRRCDPLWGDWYFCRLGEATMPAGVAKR